MNRSTVAIPTLVRIKPNALERAGVYLSRFGNNRVAVFQSAGLVAELSYRLRDSLQSSNIEAVAWLEVGDNEFEHAIEQFTRLQRRAAAVVGLGGGKALDVAKYVAFLAKLPYFA